MPPKKGQSKPEAKPVSGRSPILLIGVADSSENGQEGQCGRGTLTGRHSRRLVQPPFRGSLLGHPSHIATAMLGHIVRLDIGGSELEQSQADLCVLRCSRRADQGTCRTQLLHEYNGHPVLVESDCSERRRCTEGARCYGCEYRRRDRCYMLNCQVLNGENPFVLVHSPLVSNYDLTPMIDAHKKRREVDKNFVMTMGVGRGGR